MADDPSASIRETTNAHDDEALDEVSRQIVEGYRRQPQTANEEAWARANAVDAIREEPW